LTLNIISFVDRDMVMHYFGGSIGHLKNTPPQQVPGFNPINPSSKEMTMEEGNNDDELDMSEGNEDNEDDDDDSDDSDDGGDQTDEDEDDESGRSGDEEEEGEGDYGYALL
jgi:hypothetical protein